MRWSVGKDITSIWGGIEGRKKEKVLSFIFFGC